MEMQNLLPGQLFQDALALTELRKRLGTSKCQALGRSPGQGLRAREASKQGWPESAPSCAESTRPINAPIASS